MNFIWNKQAELATPQFRTAYVLTTDMLSNRALFSKKVLEDIGFNVTLVKCIPNANPITSNKLSMQYIYELIINSNENYAYVFEDDIDVLEPINLNEIIEYEMHSEMLFYLGICERNIVGMINTNIKIQGHSVFSKSGNVRGLHAIGLSKNGADKLLEFSKSVDYIYMDETLEKFTEIYPANVVRYDLESYIPGHKGIIFQDRRRFPSEIP